MIIRVFACVLLCASAASAQAYRDTPDAFYIGRGEDASLDAARSHAYANMVEQIQVLVTSTLRTSTSEDASWLRNTAERSTLSMSSIVLRDVREHVDEVQGIYRVVKYIHRAVVRSMFEQRRRQIIDYIAAAEEGWRHPGRIDVQSILSNYYKAWLMTGLYPDTVSYPFEGGGWSGVLTGIPQAMQRVCDKISFEPARKIDDEYTTWKYSVLCSGRPVSRLRYSFYDGLGESEEEVADGTTQATFLFTDKRERHITASIEYHDTDVQDPMLAAADSVRAPFAPKLAIVFLLPGDAAPTGRASSADDAQRTRVGVPAILRPIAEKSTDLAFFKHEISRLSKRGDIVTGKKNDFESLDGLYLIVLDGKGVQAILFHTNGSYINTHTGDAIALPEYAGKRTLWVKVQ